jgi:DNA repair exonuclease SbcCD nuclease subunit
VSSVLLVGDLHLRDRAPRSRQEPYLDEILEILLELAGKERELEVDAVVFAGDIFDFPQPARTSHRTVLRTIRAFKEFRNPWIVVGNHDTTHHRLDSVREQQPLGVLLEAGVAKELDGWHPELPIFGVPWQQHWHLEETPARALSEWRAAELDEHDWGIDLNSSLVVTHAPIYPPATRDEQLFELVPTAGKHGLSSAMNNKGYCYYGHIHEDHGFFEDEGVTYGNVGAISRGSLTEYNTEREIQAALWDSSAGFSSVRLPHKPASEVFKIAEVAQKKQQRLDLNEFLADVGSTTISISSSSSVVDHIQQLDIEPKVKDVAIELVELSS